MSKPEFTRPFNVEHAKAGAPYCCTNGAGATIFEWAARGACPLAGIIRGEVSDHAALWGADGRGSCRANDLVMLPLGLIDGKPVFVGDEFLWPVSEELATASPDMAGGDWGRCAWPVPARVYPVTQMTAVEFSVAVNEAGDGIHGQMVGIANAALRHAIDAGQLIEPGDRAARDMAVAKAVLDEANLPFGDITNYADLPAIIAKVRP